MNNALQITATDPGTWLIELPWDTPIAHWPTELLANLPRGISRHIVRFISQNNRIYAVKEIAEEPALHEYGLLETLARDGLPTVVPTAVISGRTTAEGQPLPAALITEHLSFSLPYRILLSQQMRPENVLRALDSLAVLLVRLHMYGFYWGDVSLSNTLFRRDAGEFAAYLVDAETGEIRDQLSDGMRAYELELARTNIIGELMDLQSGGLLPEEFDTVAIGERIELRYRELWDELTGEEHFSLDERWRLNERIRRLHELGFDVGELAINATDGMLKIQPKVVDAGHYHRQVMRLMGLDVEERQAQRILNSFATYKLAYPGVSDEMAAHLWMTEIYTPIVQSIPPELRGKLEDAQVFHEILEHRWYMCEQAGHEVPTEQVIEDYISSQLSRHADEAVVIDTENMTDDTAIVDDDLVSQPDIDPQDSTVL